MTKHFDFNNGINNGIENAGVGSIVIPEDVEITEYIQSCYRNRMVCIDGGDGYSYIGNVKITQEALSDIHFPTTEQKGSSVIWVRVGLNNYPVVIGVIPSAEDAGMTSNKQRRIYQQTADQIAEVFIDAINSLININVKGSDAVPAVITIKAFGSDKDIINLLASRLIFASSKILELNITDSFTINLNDGEKDLIVIKGDSTGFSFLDQFNNNVTINQDGIKIIDSFGRTVILDKDKVNYVDQFNNSITFDKDNINTKCAKFNINEGSEPLVLGNKIKSLLEELIDAINSITVTTKSGVSSTPINQSQFSSIKSKLDDFLSKVSNTD